MRFLRFAALWVPLLLAGFGMRGLGQAASPPSLPAMQSVAALGSDLFVQSGSTGMVLVVVRGKEVLFRGYGETAPDSHQAPTQDSLLRLCSLTKIFTTDVLAKLVAEKTVRLDDPLQRYAPHGAVVPRRIGPITLVDLATHTSGLPRELGNPPAHTPHFTFPNYDIRWRWLPNQRLRSAPGTAALYSNIGFDLLSDALQGATHKQYIALLAQRTLNPLHMQRTTFFPNAEQCERLLIGAHDEGPCASTEATAGSSGLYSTATDMTIWLKYLLRTVDPNIPVQDLAAQSLYIPPASLVSEKGLDHAGKPTGVGLGWIHILPVDSPSHIVEKTGGGAGFSSYIAINHARDTALFVAATDGAVDTHLNLFNAANKLLLAAAGLPPLPEPAPKRASRRRRAPPRR
ncbi:MAG TPA: D-alanyl-D-alanine-carboxypeptidase/endopeptidase AmpH [Terracidiphilus sp.]|nr:D-alanyl-D-alanine-carboxypeptidase/endopeptidase AmpH [Terracidiphilus sp.]